MSKKLTATEIAEKLDVTPRRVHQLHAEKGLPLEREWEGGRPRLVCGREPLEAWMDLHWRGNSRRWYGKELPT
jgi:hypothetical protein